MSYYTVSMGGTGGWWVEMPPPPPPQCARCGKPGVERITPDRRHWHHRCLAIEHASDWIEFAFAAAPPESAQRLYRALAAVFHPDAGGDPAVMTALNRAKEKFS